MALDEFSLIDRYFKHLFGPSPAVVIGPGDDCAVLTVPPECELCVSTDTLLEGVHFPPGATGAVVASRTVAANLSDLAAMGADPHSVVLALTIPNLDEAWLQDFSETLKKQLARFNAPLVGGNISRGPLSLTMTVLGCTPRGAAIVRSGARPGDHVYVTGTLGDAGRGLELVRAGESQGFLVERYESPTPRLALGVALRGMASAMVDVSDGLLADVSHIALSSQVAMTLNIENLPLSDALLNSAGAKAGQQFALTAGDDYELCFAAPDSAAASLVELGKSQGIPITKIGDVTEGQGVRVLDAEGDLIDPGFSGYQHFS